MWIPISAIVVVAVVVMMSPKVECDFSLGTFWQQLKDLGTITLGLAIFFGGIAFVGYAFYDLFLR